MQTWTAIKDWREQTDNWIRRLPLKQVVPEDVQSAMQVCRAVWMEIRRYCTVLTALIA